MTCGVVAMVRNLIQLFARISLVSSRRCMSQQTYDPSAVESAVRKYWSTLPYRQLPQWTRRKISPKDGSAGEVVQGGGKEPFSMILPPPNVTGYLHLGHALTLSVEDAYARFAFMRGRAVSWIPGLDHAGIATQVVVEKKLMKEQGKTRHDLGRSAFVEAVWEWKANAADKITSQTRQMAPLLDYDNHFFTLDDSRSQAVITAFQRLFEAGLIYRGARIVHWCPSLKTAISDLEVDNVEVTGPTEYRLPPLGQEQSGDRSLTVGLLHHFRYPLVPLEENENGNGNGQEQEEPAFITVATTRLETMLGDTGIAVHPDDPRLAPYIGRQVRHPLNGRTFPIVGDATLVDMDLGSGAVKLTPAHDINDYQAGVRHHLPMLNILSDEGRMNEQVPPAFRGMDRSTARSAVEDALREAGLYVSAEPHSMSLPICSRSGDVLEPMLRDQWFVKMEGMSQMALEQVRNGTIQMDDDVQPIWESWLTHTQDWCISRQLWWGHRIPAYQLQIPAEENNNNDENNNSSAQSQSQWIVAENQTAAREKAIAQYGRAAATWPLAQDEDVLDTWFSSALLPLSALGWPETTTADLASLYPLSVMETGHDILFFWVARMVMLCSWLQGEAPFRAVKLHPMIRDANGRKMSKSLGNVIDPLDVIDGKSLEELLAQLSGNMSNLPREEVQRSRKQLQRDFPTGLPACGVDALRFTLLQLTQQRLAVNFQVQKCVAARHFGNKMWQAFAFLEGERNGQLPSTREAALPTNLTFYQQWMIETLQHTMKSVTEAMERLEVGNAAQMLQGFFESSYCDIFLECVKADRRARQQASAWNEEIQSANVAVMHYCWRRYLLMLHPSMPHLTTVLWERLMDGNSGEELVAAEDIMLHGWPDVSGSPSSSSSSSSSSLSLNEAAGATAISVPWTVAVVHASRSLRQMIGISAGKSVPMTLLIANDAFRSNVQQHYLPFLCEMTRCSLEVGEASLPTEGEGSKAPITSAMHRVIDVDCTLQMPVAEGLVDVEGELRKQRKQLGKREGELQKAKALIAQADRIPADVYQRAVKQEEETTVIIAQLKEAMDVLAAL